MRGGRSRQLSVVSFQLKENGFFLGKLLREGNGCQDTVIGVAKDAQVSHLGDLTGSYLYFPAALRDNLRTYVLVRFDGGYAAVAKGIRDAVQSFDPNMPVECDQTRRLPRSLARALADRQRPLGSAGWPRAAAGIDWRVRNGVVQG